MSIQVKEYKNTKEFQKDAQKMLNAGWRMEGQSSGGREVSVGGTAAKLILTGGLGAITGLSRKKNTVTVTWETSAVDPSTPYEATVAGHNERWEAYRAERHRKAGFFGRLIGR